jgi:hypothetical protein
MSNGSRPLGVTIVGVLYFIIGILSLIGGVGIIGAGTLIGAAGLGALGGGALILVGLIDIAIGWGCFKGWGWVWTLAVIFGVINILIALYNWWVAGHTAGGLFSTIVGLIIPLIILWYLFRENVKQWFGMA